MKRTAIIIGIVALVVVGIVWAVLGNKPPTNDAAGTGNTPSTSDVADKTDETFVTVTMKNSAFTPQKIQIKKGTTVRWVNEDDIRHNVVAADENDQRELPTQSELFGKGGKFEHTFDTIGTFDYKCTPHPFMTGSVEVVE